MSGNQQNNDEINGEVRERLVEVETQQQNLQDSVEELKEGQTELLEAVWTLDDDLVEKEWQKKAQAQMDNNTKARHRWKAILKFVVVVLTIIGGFSGLIAAILL